MGEGRQLQLAFKLYYYINSMRNMFRLQYKMPSSDEIKIPNKTGYLNNNFYRHTQHLN